MKGKPALHYVGVDLGGTTMAAALLDEGGRILEKAAAPTLAHEGHDAVIDHMAQLIHQVMESVTPSIKHMVNNQWLITNSDIYKSFY